MPREKKPTVWQLFDRFPPILLRLLARHPRGKPLTTLEISNLSGLSPIEVEALSQTTNSGDVTISKYRSFQTGCKISFSHPAQLQRIMVYLRGKIINGQRVPPNYAYLRKHPAWKTYYEPMMLRWIRSLTPPTR